MLFRDSLTLPPASVSDFACTGLGEQIRNMTNLKWLDWRFGFAVATL